MGLSSPTVDPLHARQFAVEVVERLRAGGHEALWAGGCVRDHLLGAQPMDYDVATSAHPEQIRAVFGQRRTLAIGLSFGVITVLGSKQQGQIEVATFRRDAGYTDGRRPDSVSFSTAQEDAQRRDFTINGLFFDPLKEQTIDFVGGQVDLERRVIRAIRDPHERFAEDKLRMLRGVRFAATLDFAMDGATLAAIQQHASSLVVVSAERIAAEMRRMLVHRHRAEAVRLLEAAQLLEVILPELPGVDHETLSILQALDAPQFGTAFAVLLRSVAKASPDVAREVGERWRLSNDEIDLATWLLANERLARRAHEAPWPQVQRALIEPGARELAKYVRAIGAILDGSTAAAEFCEQKLALPDAELNPPPLVTGTDLKTLGLPPGPHFKTLLDALRDAQLAGRIGSAREALDLALQLAGPRPK
jgi:poly(A) polymerase